jgi:hypothetical protein
MIPNRYLPTSCVPMSACRWPADSRRLGCHRYRRSPTLQERATVETLSKGVAISSPADAGRPGIFLGATNPGKSTPCVDESQSKSNSSTIERRTSTLGVDRRVDQGRHPPRADLATPPTLRKPASAVAVEVAGQRPALPQVQGAALPHTPHTTGMLCCPRLRYGGVAITISASE